MAVMRYLAPERGRIDTQVFAHPVFEQLHESQHHLCRSENWPEIPALNALWQAPVNAAGFPFRFVDQDDLQDDAHYEQRIAHTGAIATRTRNWHDLFNAFIWMRYPAVKQALNARQVTDIVQVGPKQRTRGQCALTQFDEAGAVLRLHDATLQTAWDAHDWPYLFRNWTDAERRGAVQLWLFGHSLFEHALTPAIALVAKALVINSPDTLDEDGMASRIATGIAAGSLLNDPQELRPIPLTGIPGWHPEHTAADFFTRMPCFRPKRAGRHYPEPLHMQ
jgi:hypothetical protein